MNFIVGKDYKTRGGWKAKCIYVKKNDIMIFILFKDDTENISYYNKNGQAYNRASSDYDIISEWIEPEPPVIIDGWVNVYKYACSGTWNSKKDADAYNAYGAYDNRLECLHIRYDSSQPLEKRIVVIKEDL